MSERNLMAAAELVAAFVGRGLTMATAESLTAGMVASTIADVPGASRVLRGGLVVYATELKHTLAGVDTAVLEVDGPVAASTAAQLAEGARTRCGADWGVSLTGVAGPDTQDGHPVGTVYLGFAGPGGYVTTQQLALTGDRRAIRRAATETAIMELTRIVDHA